MKLKCYSLFDAAAAAFLPPVFLATEALLMRNLREMPVRHRESDKVKYAEQFTVFCLGEFDDATGKLSAQAPEAVVNLRVLFSQAELPLADESPVSAHLRAVGERDE